MINRRNRTAQTGGVLRLLLVSSILSIGLLAQAPDAQAPDMVISVSDDAASSHRQNPSRVIVRFQNGPSFLPDSKGNHDLGDGATFVVGNPPGLSVADAVRNYRSDPNVVFVEPDYEVSTTTDATDPLWSQQWDMVKIAAPSAWNVQGPILPPTCQTFP